MDFVHASAFVGFGTLTEGGEEAAKVHPGRVAEDDGSRGVVFVEEFAQKGVKIVRGGGEVEPGRVQGFGDLGVEVWHSWDWSRIVDECAAEDADGGGGHGNFYGVVDVWSFCVRALCYHFSNFKMVIYQILQASRSGRQSE